MSFSDLGRGIYALLLFITTAGMTACSDVDCPLYNTVHMRYGLYNSGDNSPLSLTDTLSIRAIGTDSVLYNRGIGIKSLMLPLSYNNAADTLLWQWSTSAGVIATDTLIIEKTNEMHSESMDCNMVMFHHIKSVQLRRSATAAHYPIIDSVAIKNRQVTYDATEHLHVYISK